MSQDTPGLVYEMPVGTWFFQAVQEMMSGAAHQFQLTFSGATITLPAGTGHQQVSISITGLYRWVTSNKTAVVSGAAGNYDVFVTAATANSYVGNADATDRSFSLNVQPTGSNPTSVYAYRKVATVVFDGTNISSLTQIVPPSTALVSKTIYEVHVLSMDDQTSPNASAIVLGSIPIKVKAGQTKKLWGVVHKCTTVGSPAFKFKIQTDNASHGTLADVTGLTGGGSGIQPATGAYVTVLLSTPLVLADSDELAIIQQTAGPSLGCKVALLLEDDF